MNLEEVNLRDQIAEVVSLIRVQISMKHAVALVDNIAADIPVFFETDG